jgi:hypothetical protein
MLTSKNNHRANDLKVLGFLQKSNLLFFCLPSRLTNREESSNRWLSQRPIWLLNVEVSDKLGAGVILKDLN